MDVPESAGDRGAPRPGLPGRRRRRDRKGGWPHLPHKARDGESWARTCGRFTRAGLAGHSPIKAQTGRKKLAATNAAIDTTHKTQRRLGSQPSTGRPTGTKGTRACAARRCLCWGAMGRFCAPAGLMPGGAWCLT